MRLLVAVACHLVFTFLALVLPSTCVASWCWLRLTIKVACWSNSLHGYFFPLYTLIFCLIVTFPSWILLTFMYSLLVLSEIAHWSCLMFTFSAWVLLSFMYIRWCWVRSPFEVAWWSHSLHGYFFPSCIARWCWVRSLFEVAWWSHFLHGYVFP